MALHTHTPINWVTKFVVGPRAHQSFKNGQCFSVRGLLSCLLAFSYENVAFSVFTELLDESDFSGVSSRERWFDADKVL